MKTRFLSNIAVYLVLTKGNSILLMRRCNTGFADGLYSLVSGHLEEGETLNQAMVREAQEEVGIVIDPSNIEIIHAVQRNGNKHYIDFYFSCCEWQGEPINQEPDKCSDVRFFPIDQLPLNSPYYVVDALEKIRQGRHFSEYGW